jgi:hypothetical protein
VNGERLFKDREKEVLRKMIWQLADFCGVEVLTYCVLSNHFHVLLRVPVVDELSDAELLRRFKVLYPKPTEYQTASVERVRQTLVKGGEDAQALRAQLLARMGDVSEYMKSVKQRFSIWYNRSHHRYGTLWAERFKSVLVEGQGNALQTMAAYIDLNPVRAGLVEDPKDYRFCGYAEAVAGMPSAKVGLLAVWADRCGQSVDTALSAHRMLIFGKRAAEAGLPEMSHDQALKVLEKDGRLSQAVILRCRVRYFSDGAILGSAAFVQGFVADWQKQQACKRPPKANLLRGADWGDLAVIKGMRRQVFA